LETAAGYFYAPVFKCMKLLAAAAYREIITSSANSSATPKRKKMGLYREIQALAVSASTKPFE
jgi:hypothetical protein